jgi:hypothetical protein
VPINPLDGDVLPRSSDVDGVTFHLQRPDPFQRIQADSPLGSTMVLFVVLSVVYEP